MRIHRFFVSQALPQSGDFFVTDQNLLNQWRNVLRMEEGDQLSVFDGSGDEVLCELSALNKKSATLTILERHTGPASSDNTTLFMALIKRDNFELVLQKATELGVSRIVPTETARSEKKGINRVRSEKILREASEQSGRTTVPVLDDVARLHDIFKKYQMTFVALDPRGTIPAREYFKGDQAYEQTSGKSPGERGFLIGPEGGFTEEEIVLFKEHHIPMITTGATILRAETAAIVALAFSRR